MRVEQIMTTPVITVRRETPLKQVALLLAEHAISGVPVVEGDHVVGVLSESDLVRKESVPEPEHRHLLSRHDTHPERLVEAATAEDAMSAAAITVEPWMSVWAAAALMAEHDVNRLPVVERDRLVGIVARADLVRAFARSDAEIESEIRDEILPAFALSADDIAVNVEDGEVTLAGLAGVLDVESLPRAVRQVVGVVRVHSHVQAPASRSAK